MSSPSEHQIALEPNGFPVLLRSLVSAVVVGRLEVTPGPATTRLWLDAGQVSAVVSGREEDRLGNWLVSRGVLKPHHMAVALLKQPEGVRYGTFLVMEKLIDLDLLTSELAALATKIVSSLLFGPGSYRFVPGDTIPRDAASLQLTTASLLVAAVRAVEDPACFNSLLTAESYLWAAQNAMLLYQYVQLQPHEGYLLSRIDGLTSVGVLQRLVPLPKESVVRALAGLVVAGLVEVHDEPTGRPAPVKEPSRQEPAAPSPRLSREEPVAPPEQTGFRLETPFWMEPEPAAPVLAPPPPPAPEAALHRKGPLFGGAGSGAPVAPSVPVQEVSWTPMPAATSLADTDHGVPLPEETLDFTEAQEKEHAEILRFAAACRTLDPLSRLGLTAGASHEAITLRFRDLVRRFHPDRAAEPHLRMLRKELAEISAAVLEAYETAQGFQPLARAGQASDQEVPARDPGRRRPEAQAPEPVSAELHRQAIHEKINTARRLMRQGDNNQAAELLDQAVRMGPDPKTLLYLARIEFHNPMWAQRGLDHLKHAVSKDPQFTEGWLELGNYWALRGQLEKQRQCLERILSYDPGNHDVRTALATLMSHMRTHWS